MPWCVEIGVASWFPHLKVYIAVLIFGMGHKDDVPFGFAGNEEMVVCVCAIIAACGIAARDAVNDGAVGSHQHRLAIPDSMMRQLVEHMSP